MGVDAAALRARHPFLVSASGVFTATLASFLAVGAVLPVLPRYVLGPIGAGNVSVGIVVGAFAFTAVVTRPWAGRMADARGRRIVVLCGSLLMAVAGLLLFIPAGVVGLVVARLVLGVGEGLVFTAGSAWIVDLSPAERRGQSIGFFGLAVWTGLSVGPIIGETLYRLGSFDLVWAFAVLGPLVGAAVCARQSPTPPKGREKRGGPWLPREALAPGAALALANVGYAALAGFVVLHLDERGIGHGATVFTAYAVSVVTSRLLLGQFPDRHGARRAAVFAGCAEAVGLALIAVAGAWWTAVLGGIVMGFGFSMLYPALALTVIARVGEERRGAALGAFTAFFDVGVGLGAPLAGGIAALGGYEAAFWVAVVAAASAAVISLWATRLPEEGAAPAGG